MSLTPAQATSLNYLNALGIDVWLPKQFERVKPKPKQAEKQIQPTPKIQLPAAPVVEKQEKKPQQKLAKKIEHLSPKLDVIFIQLDSNLALIADLNGLDDRTEGIALVTKIGQAIKKALGIHTLDHIQSFKWPHQVASHTKIDEHAVKDALIGFLTGKQCFKQAMHWILLGPTLEKLLQDPLETGQSEVLSEQPPIFKITQHSNTGPTQNSFRYLLHACPLQTLVLNKQAKATLWQGLKSFIRRI